METLLPFTAVLGVLLLGVISPGPSFLLVARTSIARSRAEGLAVSLGMGVGGVIFCVLVLIGLQAVLLAVPWLYSGLRIVGACYLVYLGVRMWGAAKPSLRTDAETSTGDSTRKAFIGGLLTQLSNPKTAIVYGSVFAALLPPQLPLFAIIGLPVFVFAIETGWYSLVALVLSTPAPRSAYLSWRTVLDRCAGTVMVLLGLKLLAGGLVETESTP